jgi:prostaglandin-endoperoxide synthase 2
MRVIVSESIREVDMLNFIKKMGLKAVGFASDNWPWLGKKVNKIAINASVNACRHRPHPWSTVHEYVSWTSLTNKQWNARHLPPKKLNPPLNDNLQDFFRRSEQRLSPKSTCLFPAFAQYLTDGFIRTKMGEPNDPIRKQTTSNHEIDQSPLYGRTPEQTKALRLLSEVSGEKGRLKSQMIGREEFAPFLFSGDTIDTLKEEFKSLDLPLMIKKFDGNHDVLPKVFAFGGDRANAAPQISMMNTLFLREHNRLAGLIESVNPDWDDEHVFEVARNISIVIFIKLVVEEYINHISPGIKFRADPSVAWDAPWNKPNWITTEFSLLYRWHSLIPDKIRWADTEYEVQQSIMNNTPLLKGGVHRGFIDMSAQPAGEIGAFNTAEALIPMEISAIKQGRLCDLASYSDYREYVSANRPTSFSDISSNQKVVDFLKNAYTNVEDVEYYIGLFAEDIDHNSPLPELLGKMVAVDAFSQALTNPLLSKHVWNESTFTKEGWKEINETNSLRDILNRNSNTELRDNDFVGMTQPNWKLK